MMYYPYIQEKVNRETARELNSMQYHLDILCLGMAIPEGPITSRRHFFSTSSPRLDQQQHFQTKTE